MYLEQLQRIDECTSKKRHLTHPHIYYFYKLCKNKLYTSCLVTNSQFCSEKKRVKHIIILLYSTAKLYVEIEYNYFLKLICAKTIHHQQKFKFPSKTYSLYSSSAGSGCASAQQDLHAPFPFCLHESNKFFLPNTLSILITYLAVSSTSSFCEMFAPSVWLWFTSEPLVNENKVGGMLFIWNR